MLHSDVHQSSAVPVHRSSSVNCHSSIDGHTDWSATGRPNRPISRRTAGSDDEVLAASSDDVSIPRVTQRRLRRFCVGRIDTGPLPSDGGGNARGTYLVVPPSVTRNLTTDACNKTVRETSLGMDEEEKIGQESEDCSNTATNVPCPASNPVPPQRRHRPRPTLRFMPTAVYMSADWNTTPNSAALTGSQPGARTGEFELLSNLLTTSSKRSTTILKSGDGSSEGSLLPNSDNVTAGDQQTLPSRCVANTLSPTEDNLVKDAECTGGYDSGKGSSELVHDSPAPGAGPREERLFQLKEERVAQTRHVSVEREQCRHTERAALSVEGDAKQHRAVTVSRSNTWSFQNKPNGSAAASLLSLRSAGTGGDSRVGSSASSRMSEHNDSEDIPESVSDLTGSLRPKPTLKLVRSFAGHGSSPGAIAQQRSRSHSDDRRARSLLLERFGEEEEEGSKEESCLKEEEPVDATVVQTFSLTDYDFAGHNRSYVLWSSGCSPADRSGRPVRPDVLELGSLGKEHGGIKEREKKESSVEYNYEESKSDSSPDEPLIQRCVIVQRDETGYGLTVHGSNPVVIQSIKPNGAADRAGVRRGDRIVKVNGTLVTGCNHTDVVKLIKSGGYVALTLLGRPVHSSYKPGEPLSAFNPLNSLSSNPTSSVPSPTSSLDRERISGPQAVDHDKDLEYKAQKIATIRMMQEQIHKEYEKMKTEYQRNPTEQIQLRLEVKLQMLRRVDDQLKQLTSTSTGSDDMISPQGAPMLPSKRSSSFMSSDSDHSVTVRSRPRPSLISPTPWAPSTKHRKSQSIDTSLSQAGAKHQSWLATRRSGGVGEQVSGGDSSDDNLDSARPAIRSVRSPVSASADDSDQSFLSPIVSNSISANESHERMATKLEANDDQSLRLVGQRTIEEEEMCSGEGGTEAETSSLVTGATHGGAFQPWSLGSALRKSRGFRLILPSQVKVTTVSEDATFSTPVGHVLPRLVTRRSPAWGDGRCETPSSNGGGSAGAGLQQQINVISMEDEEFSTDDERIEEPGVFSDIELLKQRPAHLAVFIHYLMSNCDASPMLFYIVSESYPTGNIKELRKWAYEIHSTFLCDKSPLKINLDDATVSAVENVLQTKSDREDAMKTVFQTARTVIQSEISDLLTDFRMKCSLGLGNLYGNHELKDVMDRQAEMKIIDGTLWKHFERLERDEKNDRSQAMAAALSTFFRSVGYSSFKNSTTLERCQSFNARDRKVFKFKSYKKIQNAKNHQFVAQHYFVTTICAHCQGILWGVGNQGYQCVNCELNVHKSCASIVQEVCSGSLTKKKKEKEPRPPGARPQSIFGNIIKRNPSTNNPVAIRVAQRLHEEAENNQSYDQSAGVVKGIPGGSVQEEDEKLPGSNNSMSFSFPRTISMPSVRETRSHSSPLSPQASPIGTVLSPQSQPSRNLYQSRPSRSSYAVRSVTQEEEVEEEEDQSEQTSSTSPKPQSHTNHAHMDLSSPDVEVRPLAPSSPLPPMRGLTVSDSTEEQKKSETVINVGRSESLNSKSETRSSIRRTHSDNRATQAVVDPSVDANNTSGSSSNSSLSTRSSEGGSVEGGPGGLRSVAEGGSEASLNQGEAVSLLNDSDLETEADLPSLESVIPKELLRKLKPKEKKRQDVINELFYTERAHVRNLKVMYQLFCAPMRAESWIAQDFVLTLFPNIEELIDVHSKLNNDFKRKKSENPVVGDFAQILVNRFSGEEGVRWKEVASKFCRHQSHALELLRLKQRKDQKLAVFLQEAASDTRCRRLELKDLIPTVMQRLTKYPLLIENLLRYTPSNTEEYDQLVRAHDCTKDLLNHVNREVQEAENKQKLIDIQRRLDKRPIEHSTHPVIMEYKKLDLSRHHMIYDGQLTWRISKNKQIDLHVLLLRDILLLLQRQDDKYILRCQSTNVMVGTGGGAGGPGGTGGGGIGRDDTKLTHSPIIKLTNLLTRNVATDKRAFFLVSTSEVGPQIYELVASTKDEKNKSPPLYIPMTASGTPAQNTKIAMIRHEKAEKAETFRRHSVAIANCAAANNSGLGVLGAQGNLAAVDEIITKKGIKDDGLLKYHGDVIVASTSVEANNVAVSHGGAAAGRRQKSGLPGADSEAAENKSKVGNTVVRWFKYITDAAEAYKGKEVLRARKPNHTASAGGLASEGDAQGQGSTEATTVTGSLEDAQHAEDETIGTASTPSHEEATKLFSDDRAMAGNAGSEDGDHSIDDYQRCRLDSLETMGRVEVLQIEQPQLVQPSEVIVSNTVCIEKLEKPVEVSSTSVEKPAITNLLAALKEKSRQIEETMNEKKQLAADILQIPLADYDNISEMVDLNEDMAGKKLRELLLGSLTQVDLLTRVINDRLTPPRDSVRDADSTCPDDEETPTPDDSHVLFKPTHLPGIRTTPSPQSFDLHVKEDEEEGERGKEGGKSTSGRDDTGLRLRDGRMSIVMPREQLCQISTRLHRHLTKLLEVITSRDQETANLQSELALVQQQITDSMQASAERKRKSIENLSATKYTDTSAPRTYIASQQSEDDSGTSWGEEKEGSRPNSYISVGESSTVSEMQTIEETENLADIDAHTMTLIPIITESLEIIESPADSTSSCITSRDCTPATTSSAVEDRNVITETFSADSNSNLVLNSNDSNCLR